MLLLHIGGPKTGSKAIQRVLHENADGLEMAAIHYPLAASFGADMDVARRSDPGSTTRRPDELRALVRDHRHVLLSHEAGGAATDDAIAGIADLGVPVRLLAFAREPVSLANSFLNQLVKAHRVAHEEVVRFDPGHGRAADALDLAGHVVRWRRGLGDADVRVEPYRTGTDVWRPFADWLGVTTGLRTDARTANPNPAADPSSLRTLVEVKRLVALNPNADGSTLVGAMSRAHARLRSGWIDTRGEAGPVVLSPSQVERVHRLYGADHMRLTGARGGTELAGSPVALHEPTDDERALAREIVDAG